jgi:hypothetical protein
VRQHVGFERGHHLGRLVERVVVPGDVRGGHHVGRAGELWTVGPPAQLGRRPGEEDRHQHHVHDERRPLAQQRRRDEGDGCRSDDPRAQRREGEQPGLAIGDPDQAGGDERSDGRGEAPEPDDEDLSQRADDACARR